MKNKSTTKKTQNRKDILLKRASFFSISTALLLIGLKGGIFLMTHSVAILSSLADSGLDLFASFIGFLAIKQSLFPADKKHRFGHGKAEAIGGAVQGIFIFVSACLLFKEGLFRFFNPEPLKNFSLGIYLMIFSIGLTGLLVLYQNFVIKQTNSVSIKADRAHYQSDFLMNLGVILSLIGSTYFGWIDSLFALVTSLYLFYTAFDVLKQVLFILMDTEISEKEKQKLVKIISSFEKIKGYQNLKTRTDGSRIFVQFDALFNETITLQDAHKTTDALEEKLKSSFETIDIVIHQEPFRK